MENVDWDKWDKLADTPAEEPLSQEYLENNTPDRTPVNSLLYHSCDFPHKDESNTRIPCPNEATHIIFNLNHSDPENPELHIENNGLAAIAAVCQEHANEAKMMTDINAMAAAQGLKGAVKGREKVTFHAHPLSDIDNALTAAGVKKGSVEEKEAQGSIKDVLRKNALRSVGGRVSPVNLPGEKEQRAATNVDINSLGAGSNNVPALTNRNETDGSQFEEIAQPQQLSVHGKYLASEREKKNFQKHFSKKNMNY